MKKIKLFYNFQEEEKWLSDMAKGGHILQNYSVFGVYNFADGIPQPINYKVDYRVFVRKSDYINYLTLFEDAGWLHVGGTKNSGTHYFVPKNGQADAEIFSDMESSSRRYKTLFEFSAFNLFIYAWWFIMTITDGDFGFSNMHFLTPGLWERVGSEFWISFLFELPFVILRVGLPFIFLAMGIQYAYMAIKVKCEYNRLVKEGV